MNYFKFFIGFHLLCSVLNIYSMEFVFHQKKNQAGESIKAILEDVYTLNRCSTQDKCIASYKITIEDASNFLGKLNSLFYAIYYHGREEGREYTIKVANLKYELEQNKKEYDATMVNLTGTIKNLKNKLISAQYTNIGFFCVGTLVGSIGVYYLTSLLKK